MSDWALSGRERAQVGRRPGAGRCGRGRRCRKSLPNRPWGNTGFRRPGQRRNAEGRDRALSLIVGNAKTYGDTPGRRRCAAAHADSAGEGVGPQTAPPVIYTLDPTGAVPPVEPRFPGPMSMTPQRVTCPGESPTGCGTGISELAAEPVTRPPASPGRGPTAPTSRSGGDRFAHLARGTPTATQGSPVGPAWRRHPRQRRAPRQGSAPVGGSFLPRPPLGINSADLCNVRRGRRPPRTGEGTSGRPAEAIPVKAHWKPESRR